MKTFDTDTVRGMIQKLDTAGVEVHVKQALCNYLIDPSQRQYSKASAALGKLSDERLAEVMVDVPSAGGAFMGDLDDDET